MKSHLKLFPKKSLTQLEEKILNYIIDNIDDVMAMGVRGIAKNNYTSTSVIMRLTKKLGFSGFIDMYYKIYPLLKRSECDEINSTHKFFPIELSKLNHRSLLQETAKRMSLSNKFFFIYATGFSSITAEYLHKKLMVLGKKSMIATGSDSAGVFENNIGYIDIFIAISKSGETEQVINKAQTAKENGLFVISFTNELPNRLASLSDINYRIEDDCKLDDLNIFPNTFFPYTLMLFEAITYEYHQMIITQKTGN